MEGTLAIIGTGRMGEALLSSLLRAGTTTPEKVICTARRQERLEDLSTRYGVGTTTDNQEAVRAADVILIAIKPQGIRELLSELGPAFDTTQTVISVLAGTPTGTIEQYLRGEVPVVRVMSNVAVEVDAAMSVVSGGRHAGQEHVEVAEKILSRVGRVLRLPEEHLDTVTALAGSGPAYFFLVVEAMVAAGVELGLPREAATELVVQALVGAGGMLQSTGREAAELREMVTSPGGTTAAALEVLEGAGVATAFREAVAAARRRGEELAAS